jgi:nitroreductase
MYEKMDHSHSLALDEVMRARHSVRAFSPTPLKKEDVDQIIRSGLIAPFASIAVVGQSDFRRFYAVPSGSPLQGKIKDLIVAKFPKYVDDIEKTAGPVPFVKMLRGGGQRMAAGLFDKPCIVIAAEKRGIPAIAPESISYSLENMWLKATSLKIGFQLLSVVSGMKLGNDPEFCGLLGITPGEYYLDCCALGYPAEGYKPAPVKYPEFESSVKWL